MGNMKPTADDGALTLVLLVQNYRSQITTLLIKNGVVVNDSTSDEQITVLVANLLKVSKSFAKDLNDFIMNPRVAEVVAGGFAQTAQYFRMSGSSYLNGSGQFVDTGVPDSIGFQSQYGLDYTSDPALPTPSNTTNSNTAPTWWSGIKANLGDYISDGIKLLGTMDTNKANTAIANAHATVAQAGGGKVVGEKPPKEEDGMSTTTIVVLSLVGVAVLGTVVYFMMRPKN